MQKDKPTRKRTRAHFVSAPGRVPPSAKTVQERLNATGSNTGNLLAGETMSRLLDVDIVSTGEIGDPESFKSNIDLIVIPGASLLSSALDTSSLLHLVEQTSQPILMAGVGARFPTKNTSTAELPEQTIRLMKMISERSKSIGVHGHFTAEILNKSGIRNTRVIGCPSVFRAGKHLLNIRRPRSAQPKAFFHGSNDAIKQSYSEIHAREVELKILKAAMALRAPFVFQSELAEIQAANGASLNEYQAGCMTTLLNLGGDIQLDDYCDYLKSHAKAFFDVTDWASFAAEHDVAVGSRISGNLLAISQGVPALFIAFDSRAIELCDTFRLPFIYLRQFLMSDLQHTIGALDFSAFESHYPKARNNFVEFLDENHMPHRM